MATSTAKTYLMYESGVGVFTKLVDIMAYPDMGSAPNKIDTTTLSTERMKTFINGLMEAPDLVFEAIYDETQYTTIKAMEGTSETFQLHFGTDGADGGKFQWTGKPVIWIMAGGIDEVRKMSIQISCETEITKVA